MTILTRKTANQYATPIKSGVIVSTLIEDGRAQTVTFRRDLTERIGFTTTVVYDRAADAYAAHIDAIAQAV